MIMSRTYRDLQKLQTFESRYNYLRLTGKVGVDTFGYDRYLNQFLYSSRRWRRTRDGIIVRDNGCDLGIEDRALNSKIIVHHMNPITLDDIEMDRDVLYDPDGLISTSFETHNAIHFGNETRLWRLPPPRRKNDTSPWR